MARVLPEAGRPVQERVHGEFRQGEDAHRFQRRVGPADVGQPAQLEPRFAKPDQQDNLIR
jgi:hypothetical protein